MRIDIIVPNFDESSDEVTLSAWYKQVGDKISKGEIIADAETSTIACGITSSYDCILAKILVQEGETIDQGTKIAVIETDLSSDISDIMQAKEVESAKSISKEVEEEIENDLKIVGENIDKDLGIKKESSQEEKKETSQPKASSADEPKKSSAKLEEEIRERAQDIVSDVLKDRSSTGVNDQIVRDIIENTVETEEKVINNLSNQAEQKFKDILKKTEADAKLEAENVKKKIIEEAQKQALAQAEALKAKIIKEYEDRAQKDANEMHQRIIQGSITEAEATKNQLLADAREKGKKEAETIINDIVNKAKASALEIAESIKKEEIAKAKKEAENNAAAVAKEIIEQAINDSKSDAREVKKDILHSAHKHIAKEAESIMRAARKEAQVMSEARIKDIMSVVVMFAEKEADAIRNEIMQTRRNLQDLNRDTNTEIEKVKSEITQSALKAKGAVAALFNHTELQVQNVKDDISRSEDQAKEMMKEAMKLAGNKAGQIEALIISDARRQAEENAKKIIDKTYARIADEIKNIKLEVLEQAKSITIEQAKEIIGATNKAVLDNVYQLKQQLMESAETAVHSSITSVVNSVKSDVANHVMNEMKLQQQAEMERAEELRKAEINEDFRTPDTGKKKICVCKPCECFDQSVLEDSLRAQAECEDKIAHKLMNNPEENIDPGVNPNNWNKPQFLASPDDENEEIDLVRRRLSERRTAAYDASVISTVSNEVDMSAILALEQAFGKQFAERYNTRLGFTPFFIKAAVEALKQFRIFNAHVRNNEIIYKENYDISIITYGNDGVSAPVIRQADKMSIAEIEKAMIALSKRALDGTLSLEEVSGGTFTVINAGVYGSIMGTDLLTPPQVATLSVHKMKNKPVATTNGVEVKPILYVSLSYDHRVSDTKEASEFLSYVKHFVENPSWQLLGLSD